MMAALVLPVVLHLLAPPSPAPAGRDQELLAAVRKGDVAAVRALLDQGVPADTKFRYDRTALSFAADRGYADVVALLLDRGADVDAKDSFYRVTPLVWAADHQHVGVVRMLLARGASGVGDVLDSGVEKKNAELVEAALATSKLTAEELSFALERAEKDATAPIAARLRQAGAVLPPKADFKVEPAILARYAGSYQETGGARQTLTLSVTDGTLNATFGGPPLKLGAFDAVTFRPVDIPGPIKLAFKVDGDRVTGVTFKNGDTERWFARAEVPQP